jgi:hemoglobin
LLVDPDGIGTINVRAPLLLNDGAIAELEATGRYDFGKDGYQRAIAKDLPNSALGWCPRLLTGHPRYLWLNRTLCLGVGELRPREARVDYDLFAIGAPPTPAAKARPTDRDGSTWTKPSSLYERLGREEGIYRLMSVSIDSLHGNEQLNRQNPKLAQAKSKTNPADLKKKVTEFICKLTGGPCTYTGRTLRASHAPLDITESDWRVFVDDFVRVMNACGIGKAEQDELLALMLSTKEEIVKPV